MDDMITDYKYNKIRLYILSHIQQARNILVNGNNILHVFHLLHYSLWFPDINTFSPDNADHFVLLPLSFTIAEQVQIRKATCFFRHSTSWPFQPLSVYLRPLSEILFLQDSSLRRHRLGRPSSSRAAPSQERSWIRLNCMRWPS